MEQQEHKSHPLPPQHFAPASRRWSRLQIRMALSYVLMTAVIVLLFEILIAAILFVVLTQTPILSQMFPHMGSNIDKLRTDIITSIVNGLVRSIPGLLLLMAPIGMLFGLITTRGLVQRLQRLSRATDHFASGDYTQRVAMSKNDEIGQLEQHFNRMAEQLEASIAQQRILNEQSARLEERARIAATTAVFEKIEPDFGSSTQGFSWSDLWLNDSDRYCSETTQHWVTFPVHSQFSHRAGGSALQPERKGRYTSFSYHTEERLSQGQGGRAVKGNNKEGA